VSRLILILVCSAVGASMIPKLSAAGAGHSKNLGGSKLRPVNLHGQQSRPIREGLAKGKTFKPQPALLELNLFEKPQRFGNLLRGRT